MNQKVSRNKPKLCPGDIFQEVSMGRELQLPMRKEPGSLQPSGGDLLKGGVSCSRDIGILVNGVHFLAEQTVCKNCWVSQEMHGSFLGTLRPLGSDHRTLGMLRGSPGCRAEEESITGHRAHSQAQAHQHFSEIHSKIPRLVIMRYQSLNIHRETY